ncbi:MAG: DUF1385 domain-containing protein [Clostridia bacterium]|nr:DUF1385 domain-containing protein [Clostridia bacterium]
MKEKKKYTSIGGSALIEGVMMQGNGKMGIAVRRSNGEIVLKVQPARKTKLFLAKIPIVRGLVNFVLSMMTSYKALMYSADISLEEIEEETGEKSSFFDSGLGKLITYVSMALGILLGVGLFMYLPTLLTDLISRWVPMNDAVKRIIVGCVKMLIFFIYMLSVSLMKDMRRVFQYHGAEHKTIFCYEAKAVLTPENAKTFKRFHPRCGTSFIVITLIVSIAVSFLIPWQNALWHSVLKVLFLPVVMGIAYECIKLAGKYDNLFTRILSAPGVWFQRITTKEPDESQLEIAIWALRLVLEDFPMDTQLIVDGDGNAIPEQKKDE